MLRHLPGELGHFFMLTKGGSYRAWNFDKGYQEIAKFHPSQFIMDYTRPFSFLIELENDH
jgi:hypothetical protein